MSIIIIDPRALSFALIIRRLGANIRAISEFILQVQPV